VIGAFIIAALAALVICALLWQDARRLRRMPCLAAGPRGDDAGLPLVSVVVPARNEAAGLGRCLDGLAAQDYPRYEVIVVDDGSTDDTPRIAASYAARFPDRLRVVAGRPLAPDWVGKCNACDHGAGFARGALILFVDADTAPRPALLRAMARAAQESRLDALSLMPFNELGSLAERAILPVFYQFLYTVFPRSIAGDPESPPDQALAIGQCFLFRAEAYRALGGHAAVKDKVAEDAEFARVLRRAGYRLGLARAPELIRVRMYRTLAEVARGLAKHATAGRRFGGWRAYGGLARLTLTTLGSPAILALAVLAGLAEPAALAEPATWLAAVPAAAAWGAAWLFWREVLRTVYAQPARLAWCMPIGLLAYLLILLRATAATVLRRGVVWKGRRY
jgi:hypothetical protein